MLAVVAVGSCAVSVGRWLGDTGDDLGGGWTAEAKPSGDIGLAALVVAGPGRDRTLVRTETNRIVGYDLVTGRRRWTHVPAGGPVCGAAPRPVGRTVVVAVDDGGAPGCGTVVAYDGRTGHRQWSTTVTGGDDADVPHDNRDEGTTGSGPVGSPVVDGIAGIVALDGGTVVVTLSHAVTGLDAGTGRVGWRHRAPSGATFRAADAGHGTALALAQRGHVTTAIALGSATGSRRWSTRFAARAAIRVLGTSPASVLAERSPGETSVRHVEVGTFDGSGGPGRWWPVAAVDETDGVLADRGPSGAQQVGGVVAVATTAAPQGDVVSAYAVRTGRRLWSRRTDGPLATTPGGRELRLLVLVDHGARRRADRVDPGTGRVTAGPTLDTGTDYMEGSFVTCQWIEGRLVETRSEDRGVDTGHDVIVRAR